MLRYLRKWLCKKDILTSRKYYDVNPDLKLDLKVLNMIMM